MKLYYFYEFGYIEISKEEAKSIAYSKILNGITGEVIRTDKPNHFEYIDNKIIDLEYEIKKSRGLLSPQKIKQHEEQIKNAEYEARIQKKIRQQAIDAIQAEEAALATEK